MPDGTTSHVHVPVPTHTPSLVPGTACFLQYMTWSGRMFLAGSYSTDQTGRLSITRLVSNHPNHCPQSKWTDSSLAKPNTPPQTNVRLPTHPLKVTEVCTWDFPVFPFYFNPSHPIPSAFCPKDFSSLYRYLKKYVQGMKLHQYGTTSCHGRRR